MGEATRDLLWVIGIFIALGVLWVLSGGPQKSTTADKPFIDSPLDQRVKNPPAAINNRPSEGGLFGVAPTTKPNDPTHSPWYKQVTLSLGTATLEIQPNREYVTLQSFSREPITISGWRLVSSKQRVAYQSPSVVIPQGVKIYDPRQPRRLEPIVLAPGDQAAVITGRMPSLSPYNIDVSFKTNICSGYLARLPNYQFTPALFSNCPVPIKAPGVQSLDDDCQNFIERLPACHTPVFQSVRNYRTGEMEPGYVDQTPNLNSRCKDFVKATYNYPACLDMYRSSSDFFGRQWFVYLNQRYELWGERRESITLYDQNGLLVDQINY